MDDRERRVLVEELVKWVTLFPDHLEATVTGAPLLAVSDGEAELKESQIVGIGGAFAIFSTRSRMTHRVGTVGAHEVRRQPISSL